MGEKLFYNYKVLKEGVQFGIRNNIFEVPQLWAHFENSGSKFLAEYENN